MPSRIQPIVNGSEYYLTNLINTSICKQIIIRKLIKFERELNFRKSCEFKSQKFKRNLAVNNAGYKLFDLSKVLFLEFIFISLSLKDLTNKMKKLFLKQ